MIRLARVGHTRQAESSGLRRNRSPSRSRSRPLVLLALALVCAAGCQGHGSPAGNTDSVATPVTATSSSARPAATTAAPTSRPAAQPAANPAGLSDAQMVGQLFNAYIYGSTATTATPAQRQANLVLYGAATGAEIVRRWHLGGIILLDHNNVDPDRPQLSTGNVDSAAQITALTAGLQDAAAADSGVRLLIGTDQEGGSVQRITDGVNWRPSELQEAQSSPSSLQCSYLALGHQLRNLGVNQDFAPVADVVRTQDGIIGDRSFGPDPTLDAQDVRAAVTGLQHAGVLATLKHWPGHGSTATDSHQALAVITETKAQWQAIDLPPFQAAAPIADSIMVGHLALPALDPSGKPATLSATLINGTLRHGLGYNGLVITDSLWMAPARTAGTPGQVAATAIQAGNDMLLMSPDLPQAYNALLNHIRADPTFRAQVRTAVSRILAAKAKTIAAPKIIKQC